MPRTEIASQVPGCILFARISVVPVYNFTQVGDISSLTEGLGSCISESR